MSFNQNERSNVNARPELTRPTYGELHSNFRRELRRIATRTVTQSHVRNALRCLDALLAQLGDGTTHQHWKYGISPESANATRAALELIREETVFVERAIQRAETRWQDRKHAEWEARQVRNSGDRE